MSRYSRVQESPFAPIKAARGELCQQPFTGRSHPIFYSGSPGSKIGKQSRKHLKRKAPFGLPPNIPVETHGLCFCVFLFFSSDSWRTRIARRQMSPLKHIDTIMTLIIIKTIRRRLARQQVFVRSRVTLWHTGLLGALFQPRGSQKQGGGRGRKPGLDA